MEAILFYKERAVGWNIRIANTFFARLLGLLVRKKLEHGEGLLLIPCKQVHTFFMSFPIDVVFLDKDARVVEMIPEMGPGRVSPFVREAWQVLELPAGTIAGYGLTKGDPLDLLLAETERVTE